MLALFVKRRWTVRSKGLHIKSFNEFSSAQLFATAQVFPQAQTGSGEAQHVGSKRSAAEWGHVPIGVIYRWYSTSVYPVYLPYLVDSGSDLFITCNMCFFNTTHLR